MKRQKVHKVRSCHDSLQYNPDMERKLLTDKPCKVTKRIKGKKVVVVKHKTTPCEYVREATGMVYRNGKLVNVNEHNVKANRHYKPKQRKHKG